jgi:PAS domain S-box-containing protein
VQPSVEAVSKMTGGAEAILESITDAFFSLDKEWAFTFMNRRAEELLGFRRGELLGRSMWEAFPGLAGSPFAALYLRVMQEQVADSITAFYPDHGRSYEVHAYPAEIGMAIYFRDVSERVLAEQKIRESELHFRLMADSIPQMVWIADASGRPIFFNQQWHSYTGSSATPLAAEDVSRTYIHPDDDAHTIAEWDRARREGSVFNIEHRILSKTGQYRWFLVRAEPYRDPDSGEIVRWFGTSTDVHDHKQAEAALKKSELRYRSLFESIDEGFCIIEMLFDSDGAPCDYRFCEINSMFEHQTGLRDAQGKTMRELVPEHERHWFEIYGKVALTGEPIRFENLAEKLHRWFDVYAFRVDEPAERRVAVLFKDITEHRNAERDLQLADRRKDEFLAMLAHELRNPLAPISAAADLLRLGRFDAACVRQTSEIIGRQVRHMTSLVDDLLDVSRVTRGLITLELATLDVGRIVADAVEQATPLLDARRHHFSVSLAPEAAFVLGDAKRLVQVVANLLNNASKYTPEGGHIVLTVEVRDEQARGEQVRDEVVRGKHVRLAVTDDGIGMAPGLPPQVFELFAQAERSADRSQGGLGIGLALVKSLVELHHGSVSAHSAGLGLGSEFSVCLPLAAKADEAQAESPFIAARPQPDGLRVLLVEDNEDAAEVLAMFLEAAGHRVSVEHDSIGALIRGRREKPEVCLLDIGLPDIDGCELARRMRAQPELAGAVLIALTGYGQEQDRSSAIAAGFTHYFVKPVDTSMLSALLDQLRLQKSHAASGG